MSESNGNEADSAKWRCEWCGKPHSRDDPPCDNCGHHKFEEAIVPVAPDNPDHVPEPVWVCTECGRQHQKNSPPCSRCGNATLQKHVPDEADYADELETPSYVDLLEPQYIAGFVFALVAGGVLILALLGVVTLPGMGGDSLLVRNVPGDAESANGVALAEVEDAYVTALNEQRTEAGLNPLTRNDRLDSVARFANQRRAKAAYGNGTTPTNERLGQAIGGSCNDERIRLIRLSPQFPDNGSVFDSADALANALVETHFERVDNHTEATLGQTGVDVHVGPNGHVFVTQLLC